MYVCIYIYMIMSSANRDNFTSFLPVWMLFISYFYVFVMAGVSSTMLNRNEMGLHPCLVSDLGGKIPVFPH